MIVLYGRRLSKEKKSSKPKVGVNMAMVEWDQLVFVTTRGQRAKMLVADMPTEEFQEKEVNPRRGHQTKWEKDKLVH